MEGGRSGRRGAQGAIVKTTVHPCTANVHASLVCVLSVYATVYERVSAGLPTAWRAAERVPLFSFPWIEVRIGAEMGGGAGFGPIRFGWLRTGADRSGN